MPRFCAAYDCSNSSDKALCKSKSISFHRFPLKEPDKLNQWVHQMKRNNFTPNEHSVLCSEHFNEESFENNAPSNKRRILKKEAIPTKFTFNKAGLKRKRTSSQFDGFDFLSKKMVNSCSAYGCNARYRKGLSFFKFPKDEIRRVKWMIAVRRSNWLPSDSACLCAKHFQTGRPSRDENHPDYIPNVFIFNEHQTRKSAKSYEKSKSCVKKYNISINDADETNSVKTEAAVTPIKFSGSDSPVPREPSRNENHPDYVPNVFIFNEHQTRKSAESYVKIKPCVVYNRSKNDADEIYSGKTEAAVSPIKFSGSDSHVPRCNSCLCKDAEIYFLEKERDKALSEIKMLQSEVQILREEIQKKRLKYQQ